MRTICVYCGSSSGRLPIYKDAAIDLGNEILSRGLRLVYGGANVGIMGQIANTVMQGGGEVIGIMPKALVEKEVSHELLTELHVVDSMHERKAKMAAFSDAFIALPGGFGTLEELFEMLTWAQLGFHQKPCGLLNIGGYYEGLISFVHHATEEQFVKPLHRDLLLVDTTPAGLLTQMTDYQPPKVTKWISEGQT